MLQFAPNLTTIFTEFPFLDRFKKVKDSGFSNVEFQFPYDVTSDSIRDKLQQYDLQTVLFNLPPGNWEKGDRGIAIFPDRRDEFHDAVERAIQYALHLDCTKLHCMAGVLPSDLEREEALIIFKENLSYAANRFQKYGLTLLIEPINPFDIPNYFLNDLKQAIEIIHNIGQPNIKLQFDFYHIQRMQGELLNSFKKYQDDIAHVQIADNPGRHQPGTGEINYNAVFRFLERQSYQGCIGLEYNPKGRGEDSFSWLSTKNYFTHQNGRDFE